MIFFRFNFTVCEEISCSFYGDTESESKKEGALFDVFQIFFSTTGTQISHIFVLLGFSRFSFFNFVNNLEISFAFLFVFGCVFASCCLRRWKFRYKMTGARLIVVLSRVREEEKQTKLKTERTKRERDSYILCTLLLVLVSVWSKWSIGRGVARFVILYSKWSWVVEFVPIFIYTWF